MFVDRCGKLWGCGWNEHGNLVTGNDADSLILTPATGAQIVAPPPSDGTRDVLVASGGAHVLAIRKTTGLKQSHEGDPLFSRPVSFRLQAVPS
jgi:alpha-tubulin suppressor-like RCC1 family protein